MALPIAGTPTLRGREAREFRKQHEANNIKYIHEPERWKAEKVICDLPTREITKVIRWCEFVKRQRRLGKAFLIKGGNNGKVKTD